MLRHEKFEELCARAPLGALTADEYRTFEKHLSECKQCQRLASEFKDLVSDLPSAVEALAIREQEKHGLSRFLVRADTAGIGFSPEVEARWADKPGVVSLSSMKRPLMAIAGIAASLLIGAALGLLAGRARQATPVLVVERPGPVVLPPLTIVPQTTSTADSLKNEVERLRVEKDRFQAQLAIAERQQIKEGLKLDEARAQLTEKTRDEANSVQAVAKLRSEKDELVASFVAQQQTIAELNEKIKSQAATEEQDRQLTAAAKDVRQLMGERRLHVIDVFDVESSGKSRKAFGRVFYTEGKSLIFYAFDLNAKGRSKVSFQAWGQKPQQANATNLGLFVVDDQPQNRWILRIEDPTLLSSLDMLFVTMEKPGGADRPSGERLLYAYLKNPVNHP